MNRYAVFLDIDGTLTSGNAVPQENINAIAKAQAAGHMVFYNTGRSFGYIPECCKNRLKLDGFVAGIGSHVVCGGTELKRAVLTKQEVFKVFEYYLLTDREVIMEGESYSLACNITDDRPNNYVLKSADEVYTKYADLHLTKGFLSGVLPIEEQNRFSAHYNFFQHPQYAEYSALGCTKASGMQLILDYCGIPKERCIAMGDSLNDVDMLEAAGISVAMGNAPDYIKEKCSFVTLINSSAGVANALYKLLSL